ncbi:unnamed protein product [Arctia plantaginis]|uniref:Uncharacterized protein n=1 Tax=Arctia plantaginis TaxID=874455 RepID=A0A8S0YW59_ARCPL|nr:unnamed protein product [Arctia plantaginis]CAB3253457.1 unnamed protein product [Arctia plantaginis]
MPSPFVIVVSVAISLKLIFLTFSIYFTLKNSKGEGIPPTAKNDSRSKSLFLAWKQVPRILMPKFLYCPKSSKDTQNKS